MQIKDLSSANLKSEAMDDDEMELTREELQMFIQDSVNRKQLMSENMKMKFRQLQSLLVQKEKLSTDLLRLFESVSKCEATVRHLYSKLGWEYKDTVPEGNSCNDCASNSGATYETDDVCSASPVSNDITAADSDEELTDDMTEERPKTPEPSTKAAEPRKELRVVLKRLPMKLRRRPAPTPSTSIWTISDNELSSADSDYQPSASSSDSDFSLPSTKSERQKKKKMCKSEKVPVKIDAQEGPVSQSAKSEPPANTNGINGATATDTTPKPEVKSETKPFAISEKIPAIALPPVLQEPTVGMEVLARRKKLMWESGKIAEIVEKEDGTKKFKVTFEDKGKVLVSGHHIAYNAMPKLVHLAVGGRVVSKSSSKNSFFSPGILGELPSRKNHMRFLVFFDDQKTSYVALPVLRLVFKPLPDPLDDIREEEHKLFMKEYLQRMPYPPHTQFRVGQKIKVSRDGVLEACTVVLLDCSLMEVVYTKDEEKEWIYRGSIRLEHIINMKEQPK